MNWTHFVIVPIFKRAPHVSKGNQSHENETQLIPFKFITTNSLGPFWYKILSIAGMYKLDEAEANRKNVTKKHQNPFTQVNASKYGALRLVNL